MIRLLVFLAALLFSSAGLAAVAFVQEKTDLPAVASSNSLTFDASTGTTKTVIVACAGWDDPDDLTSVDDASSLLTWTAQFAVENASFESAACWTAPGTSAITQVDFIWSGDHLNAVIAIYEFSSADSASISANSAAITDSISHDSGTVPAETGGVMVGVYGGNTADFTTNTSPWTDGDKGSATETSCTGGATTDCRMATQYRLVASGGALQFSVTAGGSNRDSAIGVLEIGPAVINEHKRWRGAIEPDDTGAVSGNITKRWRGAVEPTETAAAGSGSAGAMIHKMRRSR